ncbi:hypothetical protein JHK85_006426 [Glycine max]|nr:hypothetical protein JHK85_006426 [Glycine max]
MELKQAKFNLNRTTSDIADVRASVESLNKKLEKERLSLEKTRERLAQNSSKICSLEEELNQTKLKLLVAKDAGSDNHSDITRELQRLSFEAEHFKNMGEAAKSEVMKAMSEIEQTKAMIKTAEIRITFSRCETWIISNTPPHIKHFLSSGREQQMVDAANQGKLAVEEALRKWQSEGHKRRSSIHNSTKFKNAYPSHNRKDSRLLNVNGLNLEVDDAGRIRMKPERCMHRERSSVRRKESLGQMLGKQNADPSFDRQAEKENGQKPFSAKRKKFGFGRFSLLLTKQQKKKKPTLNLR